MKTQDDHIRRTYFMENTENKRARSSVAMDLTEGQPMKLIIRFAVPLLLGILLQQFYSLVDSLIVGRYVGREALAGVGSTGSVNFIVLGLCMGVCNGFSVLIAQRFGARDYSGLRKAIANSIWLCVFIGVTVTVVVVALCKQILIWMNTPDTIFHFAYVYIVIIFAGIPMIILYNFSAGVLRALGDSKSPIIFLAVAAVLNIGLDLILIVYFHMGTEGAAIATVVSQGISGIMCVIYIKKRFPLLAYEPGEKRPDRDLMKLLLGIGLPMGLQYSITGIGSVILQTSVNGLGDSAIAAIAAALKVHILLSCPLDGLGQAMAPFAGQNVGAKKIDRISQGLKSAVICGFCVCAILIVIVFFIGRGAVSLFLDRENLSPEIVTEIIEYGNKYLIITAFFDVMLALVNIVRFTIQGMGFSGFAMFAGLLEMIARILAGVFLVPWLGFTGACLASPLAWIFADSFLVPAFFHCRKKLMKAADGQFSSKCDSSQQTDI